jgi:hypothetical protein
MKKDELSENGRAAVDDVVAMYEAIADRIRHDTPVDLVPHVASRLAAAAYAHVMSFDEVREDA